MDQAYNNEKISRLKTELNELEREWVDIDGIKLKPSQCYRLETDPAHVLFNTNCPDALRERINALLTKYLPQDESSAS